jgi:hypothetical protein
MKCKNNYCIHNALNIEGSLESWNDTDCGLFEIDPYDKIENPTGFSIEDCKAKKRYAEKAGVFLLDYKKMKPGDSFFIPNIKDTKSCNTVYRNVRKLGLSVALRKEYLNGVIGVKIDILNGEKCNEA